MADSSKIRISSFLIVYLSIGLFYLCPAIFISLCPKKGGKDL
ncbi:hypothetical protein PRABACTJOHN_00919, partial [Parabacteroides johnsonii DSM 18315]